MEWRPAALAAVVLFAGLVQMSTAVTTTSGQGLVETSTRHTTTPGLWWPGLPDGKYLIMFPKSMRVGQTFSVTIQVFDLVKNLAVTASLQNRAGPIVTEEILFKKGTHSGSVELKVPNEGDAKSYTLRLTGESQEDDGHPIEKGLRFKQERYIPLHGKGVSVFIQTDKALYKPSQTVHFRAMAVYPDLKPYLGKLDIELLDAEGNKIKQYKGITNPGHNGVITKQLELSDQPVLGDWKINVNALDILQTKTFTVAEYVLPKFKVTIDAPPFFYYIDDLLTINVGARYTYGKKVKGVAEITVQLSYKSYELNGRKPPQHKITVQDFDGSTTLKLLKEELLDLVLPPTSWYNSYDPLNIFKYKTILVSTNVTEAVSDITQSDKKEISVETQRYKLKFMAATPSSFKPGLTYTGFVKLSRMDGSAPLPSDLIKRNGEMRMVEIVFTGKVGWSYRREKLTQRFPIQPSGLVRFALTIPDNFTKIDMRATFRYVAATKYGVKKFKSRSGVGIQVALVGLENGGAVKPNTPTQFLVKSTEGINTFNLVFLSKGMLVLSKYIHRVISSRKNTVDFTFNSSTAQKLSPSARVVVWYLTEDSEVITDSLDFNVEGVFSNEVSLSFDKNTTRPGKSLNLKVTADPASYVGLLAVDQSVLLLKGGNDITQKDVIDELKTYDSGSGQPQPDPMPLFMRCMFCGWPVFSGGTDSTEIFDSAGVYVITNADVYRYIPTTWAPVTTTMMMTMPTMTGGTRAGTTTTTTTVRPDMMPDRKDPVKPLAKATVTRTHFPETWLWTDAITGDDGETTLEVKAPDTITSWVATAFAMHRDSGLGLSATSKLTVFQPFFVSLNLPYSVIRGEEFGLQAMVFNYLPESVVVKVTLSKSDSFEVRSADDLTNAVSKEVVVWIRVPANEAKPGWFWIVPGQLGNIAIEVKAQSHLAADAVKKNLLVEPEGTPQEYSKTILIDFSRENDSLTETVNITLPPDLVEGSEYIRVTAIGDLMGTSIQGLGSLLRMPYGCGEQNMINFAPAIFIMNYLTATDQVTPKVKAKALKVMETGYMRELTYQHKDGSFSAFGDSDTSGSMWLSAFVAKSFRQAQSYIFIDSAHIEKTLSWIISRQNKDGSFTEPSGGRVIHTNMQGGSSKGLPLTAYVLVALVENKDTPTSTQLKSRLDNAIASAMAHLESEMDDIAPYALAIVTYALTVSKSSKAAEALEKLNQLVIKEGGMTHWETEKASEPDPSVPVWRRPYHRAGASNIEMTAYGLLTYTAEHNVANGLPILKWLASQQSPNGGFSSTQDTVLALQAMAELSVMTFSADSLSLDISLQAGGVNYKYDTITKATAGILQSKQLPGNINQVVVKATGKGIGIVQVAVSYNVDKADNQPGVVVDIDTTDKGNGVTKIKACGRYTEEGESGMTVLEVGLVSGNQPDTTGLINQVDTLKRVETKDRKVVLYFDELTKNKTCVQFDSHQDMPVTNPKKSRVEGYLYYKPDVKDTKYYLPAALQKADMCSVCRECCIDTKAGTTAKPGASGAACVMSYVFTICLSAIVGHLLVF